MAGGRNNLARDAAVGAMVVASIALLGYMATRLGTVGRGEGRALVMVFEDATGLIETAPVAISGVKIGSVRSITYADGGAKVIAGVRPDVKVWADASAHVKAKSLLGEKFVALDPGTEAAGPLAGDVVKTRPSGDIDRMAAAIARIAETLEPEDVKEIVHGLAVALGEGGEGTSVPEAIRDVGRDLHALSKSLEGATGTAREVAEKLKPVLARLDEVGAKAGKTLDGLDPAVDRLPETLANIERASKRIDALLARAEKVQLDDLKRDIKKILQEEGVYVRMKSRKVKDEPGGDKDEDAANPFVPRRDEPVPAGKPR